MTTTRLPADTALLTHAARLADLPLSTARAQELLPLMDEVYQALTALDPASLDETPPVDAYDARWAQPEQSHG